MTTTSTADPASLPLLRVAGVPEHFNYPWHIAIDVHPHPTHTPCLRTPPPPQPQLTPSSPFPPTLSSSPFPPTLSSSHLPPSTACSPAPACVWSGRM